MSETRRVSDLLTTIGRLSEETSEHSSTTSIIARQTNKLMLQITTSM